MLHADTAVLRLRAEGMRLTPQRRALIDVLADNTLHPSADEIASRVRDRVPEVSLSTIYATLHEFTDLGLVRRIDAPGAMRFDAEAAPHGHLCCIECGAVIDLDIPPDVLLGLADAAAVPAHDVEVTLRSVCPACVSRRDRKGQPPCEGNPLPSRPVTHDRKEPHAREVSL